MKHRLLQVVLVPLVLLATSIAYSQVTITIDEALPAGDYVISPAVVPPPPDPDPDIDPDPAPDPDTGPEPDPDPGPMPDERPNLGGRGLAQNNAWKGPYVPAVSRMPSLKYVGGFTIPENTFGPSSIKHTKSGISVSGNAIWVTGDRTLGRSFGAFEIPELADNPADAVARNIVPFTSLGGRNAADLTGVYVHDGLILASSAIRYDAKRNNTCYLHVLKADGTDRRPCYNFKSSGAPEWLPQMSSGSFFKPPESMVDQLGGTLCMHGEHWLSIISRVSAGPSLSCFTPDFSGAKRAIEINPLMYYPHKRTVGQHGSSGVKYDEAEDVWKVAQGPSNPIFNRLTKYEVSFLWPETDSYISIGLAAGQKYGDWYGPRNNQPRTHRQKGTHTGHPSEMPQGRLADGWPAKPGSSTNLADLSNYYWITPISAILDAKRPWSPEPVEWGYFNQLLPKDERPGWIRGAFFDTNRLYLMSGRGVVRVYAVGDQA